MAKKYILFSLDDNSGKTNRLAEVLNSKVCKKILNMLSEIKEATESEIAEEIKSPLNTVEYNLKKLLETGIVEKSKNYFWSRKGRKIKAYKISNKSIMINPKSKSIINKVSTSVITIASAGVLSIFIRNLFKKQFTVIENQVLRAGESALTMGQEATSKTFLNQIISLPTWMWFIAGSLFALIIIFILNWKKI